MNKILRDLAKIIIGFNLAGALIVSLILSSQANAAEEKEKSVEKPEVVWVYSVITWYDKVPPFTNEFFHKSKGRCLDMRASINAILTQYEDDALFGWIGECTKRVSNASSK